LNHSKIILVGCISAFVAITTLFLGVTGTIIGSVLSSVLYNVFLEVLEKPVENAKISGNFEWDIAYVFPLIVILIIQLLLTLAFLSEWGILPQIFLNIYLSIQGVAANNLYRILGLSLVVMCAYPFVIKGNHVKKTDGIVILLIGLMFLARGFSDFGSSVSRVFHFVYSYVDFPIALIAFLLLIYVIHSILSSTRNSDKDVRPIKINDNRNLDDLELKQTYRRRNASRDLDDLELKQTYRRRNASHDLDDLELKQTYRRRNASRDLDDLELKQVHHRRNASHNLESNQVHHRSNAQRSNRAQSRKRFNESAKDFQFESNDLLDDFKK